MDVLPTPESPRNSTLHFDTGNPRWCQWITKHHDNVYLIKNRSTSAKEPLNFNMVRATAPLYPQGILSGLRFLLRLHTTTL